MDEIKDKMIIEISDEGVIFGNGLLMDYGSLSDALSMYDCVFEFSTIHGYETVMVGLSEYLYDKETIIMIHDKLSIIKDQWDIYNSLNNI